MMFVAANGSCSCGVFNSLVWFYNKQMKLVSNGPYKMCN